jgi:predicted nucleotidyltransferase component of viral defense system
MVRARGFVLAGGTALAMQLGHRISEDLDFFSTERFSTDELFRGLKKAGLAPSVLQEEKDTLTVNARGTKLSFFLYPYPFLERQRTMSGIPLAGVIDIASMKVMAITQRGAKRDFIDLYHVLKDVPFRKVAENMVRRYGDGKIGAVHVGKSLVFFEDAESDPEPRYCGRGPEWDAVKRFFRKNTRQMVLDLEIAGPEAAKGT